MCKSSVCNFASLCCYISLKSSSPRLREVSFLVIVTTKSQFPTFQQMQETSFTSIRIYHVCIARCILRCNVLWCCCLSQLSIGAAKKLSGLSWFTTQRLYCIIKEFGISKTGPWSQALNLAEVCVFATAWNIANVVNLVFTFLFPVFFSLSFHSFSYPSLFLPFVSCEFFYFLFCSLSSSMHTLLDDNNIYLWCFAGSYSHVFTNTAIVQTVQYQRVYYLLYEYIVESILSFSARKRFVENSDLSLVTETMDWRHKNRKSHLESVTMCSCSG